jgi:flagellar protein FliO/FliZ
VNLFWETVKLVVVLGIILMAIVYVIKFGLIRLQPDYYQKKGSLRIVERLPLSQRSGLFLVRAGERHFLLGVSADNINMLAEVNSEEVLPSLPRGEHKEFKSCLDKYLTEAGENASFKEKMRFLIRKKFHGGHFDGKNGEK